MYTHGAKEEYAKALRLGQKEYRELAAAGKDPCPAAVSSRYSFCPSFKALVYSSFAPCVYIASTPFRNDSRPYHNLSYFILQ